MKAEHKHYTQKMKNLFDDAKSRLHKVLPLINLPEDIVKRLA